MARQQSRRTTVERGTGVKLFRALASQPETSSLCSYTDIAATYTSKPAVSFIAEMSHTIHNFAVPLLQKVRLRSKINMLCRNNVNVTISSRNKVVISYFQVHLNACSLFTLPFDSHIGSKISTQMVLLQVNN